MSPSDISETTDITSDVGPSGRSDLVGGFLPVIRETLSSQVREQLLDRIVSGALAPGAQVPSERTLSDQFGVARTSVREAKQGLESIGVVVRRGNRWYVAENLPEVSFDRVDDRKEFVRQLFEARRLLEIRIIELAAKRADQGQRVEINGIAAGFHQGMDLEEFRELDRAFHVAISMACGNPILIEVYAKLLRRLFRSEALESLLIDDVNRDEVGRIVGDSTRQHAALAAAVAAGDVDAARREGVAHLAAVERGLIDRLV